MDGECTYFKKHCWTKIVDYCMTDEDYTTKRNSGVSINDEKKHLILSEISLTSTSCLCNKDLR